MGGNTMTRRGPATLARCTRRDNRLVYIARVTGVEVDGESYENEAYEGRLREQADAHS